MIALLSKELRQLLPIAWLWLAVLALGYAVQLFTERLDEETFASWCEGYCDPGAGPFVAAVSILFTLVTAYSLFPREHDEATIDFLRALPIPRWRIYAAKVLAAWALLVGINVASYGLDAALLATNPESLGGRFLGQVWWTLLWRDALFAFVILAHGVVLSWFRTVGLVVYAVYVLLLMWYESEVGPAGLLSVFGFLVNDYDGQRLVVDARAIGVHVGVACALLVLGERLWSRTLSDAAGGRATSPRGARLVRVAAGTLAFVALAGVTLYRVDAGNGTLSETELGVVATEHYRFVYRLDDAATVTYLVEHAEADMAAVAELLGVTELPFVRVDLSASSEHAAGLAKWKKIQMDLATFEEDVSQRRVLAHELTHVLQATESNRALARQFRATQFFIEGMAQHVSFEVVPEPARRASNHALAAVARARQDIDFDDLIDAAAFARRFDPELYYSLGDTWSVALVATCGASALGDFLRAAGRESASQDIGGELFWRDTFREIGCELDAVNSAWARRMEAAFEALEPARFPVFEDVVVARDAAAGVVRVSARLRAADGADDVLLPTRAVVRVRSAGGLAAGVDPVFRGTLEEDEQGLVATFRIPVRVIPRARFDYQLGYEPRQAAGGAGASDSRVYYEGWRGGSAP